MRIPLYRTQAAPTGEAPGRSIRARMSMEPFVNEALSRGAVVGEALDQIGKYAAMRYEAAVEAQLSEKLLGAEAALREKAREMEASSDPYSVFDTDNRWERETASVKAELMGGLRDRRALQKFNDSFGQMELGMRFSLRGKMDSRIAAAEAAALAARQAAYVAFASDPDLDPREAGFFEQDLRNSGAAMVAGGRANGAAVQGTFSRMDLDIAKNVTTAYVANDPMKAFALMEALDASNALQRGEITEDEYAQTVMGLGDAQYTFLRLRNVSDVAAIDILDGALKQALVFDDARRKMEQRFETQEKDIVTSSYNRFFGFDPGRNYTLDEVASVVPITPQLKAFADSMGGTINGGDVQRAILAYTGSSNYLTPDQREAMEGTIAAAGMPTFAAEDNRIIFSSMLDRKERGTLTVEELQRNAPYLKQETFTSLLTGINTRAEESVSLAKRLAASQFGYDELLAADPDRGRQAKASYQAVVGAIELEAETARISGAPLTSQQVLARTQELIGEQMVFFKDALRVEYAETVEAFNRNTVGLDLSPTDTDPLARIEMWYEGLSDEQQKLQATNYARIKTIIRGDYISKGIFE
jgi:hypothetical protein